MYSLKEDFLTNLPLMKEYNRILEKVAAVNKLAFLYNLGMLFHHKPTNMREEKSSLCVVGIGICFGIFMVHSVISNPIEHGILK